MLDTRLAELKEGGVVELALLRLLAPLRQWAQRGGRTQGLADEAE